MANEYFISAGLKGSGSPASSNAYHIDAGLSTEVLSGATLIVDLTVLTSELYGGGGVTASLSALASESYGGGGVTASLSALTSALGGGASTDSTLSVLTSSLAGGGEITDSLPALSVLFEGTVIQTHGDLIVDLPAIVFAGVTNNIANILVDATPISATFGTGAGISAATSVIEGLFVSTCNLSIELPSPVAAIEASTVHVTSSFDLDLELLEIEFTSGVLLDVDFFSLETVFTGLVGDTGTLLVNTPKVRFSSYAGAVYSSALPEVASLFSGTTGTIAAMQVAIPTMVGTFGATVHRVGNLYATLPLPRVALTAKQTVLGALSVRLPAEIAALSGYTGNIASLISDFPGITALLSGYPTSEADIIAVLPTLRALFEGSNSDRFDDYILKYVRPS